MEQIIEEFKKQVISRMEENTSRILKCLDKKSENDLWIRPNRSSNSSGTILVHVCGNIRQYIMSAIGGIEDTRDRDIEFETKSGFNRAEMAEKVTATLNEAMKIIGNMDAASMLKVYSVQGFKLTGMGIVTHVLEHYSYHAGQVIFWTKLLVNEDLGFYAGIDLNAKNKPA